MELQNIRLNLAGGIALHRLLCCGIKNVCHANETSTSPADCFTDVSVFFIFYFYNVFSVTICRGPHHIGKRTLSRAIWATEIDIQLLSRIPLISLIRRKWMKDNDKHFKSFLIRNTKSGSCMVKIWKSLANWVSEVVAWCLKFVISQVTWLWHAK